ncbi:MAG TPA: GGDEF domain-containing protein [Acidiferrobacteraceae bacterium]|nr:GGDEF domain-containing protein [Acidiferrobacteraceae bacterium]
MTDANLIVVALSGLVLIAVCLVAFLTVRGNAVTIETIRQTNADLEVEVAKRDRQLQTANARLVKLVSHDFLTGLANRSLLREQLGLMMGIAARESNRLAVLFVDLKGFKDLNEEFGQEAGDQVLTETAARLQKAIRKSDLAARVGADEFVVVLNKIADRGVVTNIANKILTGLSGPHAIGEKEISVQANVGVSLYPDDSKKIYELLSFADRAMVRAKQSDGSNVSYHGEGC